jgi:hypothetical protein
MKSLARYLPSKYAWCVILCGSAVGAILDAVIGMPWVVQVFVFGLIPGVFAGLTDETP